MIQALIEENKKEMKEVPQELAKQEEVVLEEVKEIVHSPENEVEQKAHLSRGDFARMSVKERIQARLNN